MRRLALGFALMGLAGCHGATEHGAALVAGEKAYPLAGQVIEIHLTTGSVLVEHPPAGRLDAGRTELKLRDASLEHIGDLQPGDRITGRVVVEQDGSKALDEVLVHEAGTVPGR